MPIVDGYLLARSPAFTLTSAQEDRTDLQLSTTAATTGRVRGTVTSSAGGAIAGATVKLLTPTGSPVQHTETGSDGAYVLEDVPSGNYVVLVAAPGFFIPAEVAFTLPGSATRTVNFILTPLSVPTGSAYGFVTDAATGAGIGGAVVVALQIATGFDARTTTDAAGQYLFCNIPDGNYILFAEAPGYLASLQVVVTITAGSQSEATITLPTVAVPRATVNGIITDNTGTPIGGAVVGLYSLGPDGLEALLQVTFTDAQGRYLFGRVGPGTYVIKAKTEVNLLGPPAPTAEPETAA